MRHRKPKSISPKCTSYAQKVAILEAVFWCVKLKIWPSFWTCSTTLRRRGLLARRPRYRRSTPPMSWFIEGRPRGKLATAFIVWQGFRVTQITRTAFVRIHTFHQLHGPFGSHPFRPPWINWSLRFDPFLFIVVVKKLLWMHACMWVLSKYVPSPCHSRQWIPYMHDKYL